MARHHASQYLTKGIREYSQWFPGVENQVADALSRDDDRSDEKLTKILRSHCPSQVPQHFEIVPLPSEIISWLTSLLRRLRQKLELAEAHTRTMLGRGPATPSTAIASASPTDNEHNGFNCWRLVFVADGITLIEEASSPKDGGGDGTN